MFKSWNKVPAIKNNTNDEAALKMIRERLNSNSDDVANLDYGMYKPDALEDKKYWDMPTFHESRDSDAVLENIDLYSSNPKTNTTLNDAVNRYQNKYMNASESSYKRMESEDTAFSSNEDVDDMAFDDDLAITEDNTIQFNNQLEDLDMLDKQIEEMSALLNSNNGEEYDDNAIDEAFMPESLDVGRNNKVPVANKLEELDMLDKQIEEMSALLKSHEKKEDYESTDDDADELMPKLLTRREELVDADLEAYKTNLDNALDDPNIDIANLDLGTAAYYIVRREIKDWLDENLQTMVNHAVEREISKLLPK